MMKNRTRCPLKRGAYFILIILSFSIIFTLKIIEHNEQEKYTKFMLCQANKNFFELKKENYSLLVEKESLEKENKKIKEENKKLKEKATENSTSQKTISTTNNISTTINYLQDEYGKYYECKMKITAYCSCAKCCGKYAYNRPKDANGNDIVKTASGANAKHMYTLSAGKHLNFGTKIYIPNVGMCEVQDRGGGVSGNHLDMYFSSHSEALNWGCKTLTVKIYI